MTDNFLAVGRTIGGDKGEGSTPSRLLLKSGGGTSIIPD
jgi:hypothetical protein